jgi:outer membrane protein assembly factor BamB
MAASGDLVFASAGYPEKIVMAIRADGRGDVTDTHIVWRAGRGHAYVPSPVHDNDRLYVVSDEGIATCFHATTGAQLWQQRLGGNFFASPIVAGGNVYAANDVGIVHIYKAADSFQEVATIDMGEPIMATPAICGGKIYLRTEGHLYCIGGGN